jgi:hypothetical protein
VTITRLYSGDTFPSLTITPADGQPPELPGVLAGHFGVVLVFRGGWCPYCASSCARSAAPPTSSPTSTSASSRCRSTALLSTFVYVFGYVLSVAAELCHSLARRTRGGPPGGTLALAAIALAMVFSVCMAGATGAEAVQPGTVLILIGIPGYVVTRRTNASRRSRALC